MTLEDIKINNSPKIIDERGNLSFITLNKPYFGLHIPPGIWAAETGFSPGSICLSLTSHQYDPDDYIREYQEILKIKQTPLNTWKM